MRVIVRRVVAGAAVLAATLCNIKTVIAQIADPFPVFATDACSSNPWLIPFAQGSAELSAFAHKRLDGLIAAWHIDAGPVLASGRVDGMEEGHDPSLPQRRLQAVVKALLEQGMPSSAIWTRADGSDQGFVKNQAGVSESQNRIVLVTLARGGEQCSRNMIKARIKWVQRNCSIPNPKADKAACDDAMSRIDEN